MQLGAAASPPAGTLVIALALAVVAFLYGAVGHAGATGYIAVFALAGLAPEQIRPTALLLSLIHI